MSYFKNQMRTQRKMITAEDFNKGMMFTKAPIDEGYARLLVNYDIRSDGQSIGPRKGYVITSKHAGNNTNRIKAYANGVDGEKIIESRNVTTEDGQENIISIFLQHDGNRTSNKHAYAIIAKPDVGVNAGGYSYAIHLDNNNYIYTPDSSLPIDDYIMLDKSGNPVGCFNYSDYYYFTNAAFKRMKYNTSGSAFVTEILTPKEINATVATTTGFNMLAANPYSFSHTKVVGAVAVDGVMLKDSDGNATTRAYINEENKLHVYFSYNDAADLWARVSIKKSDADGEYTVIESRKVHSSSVDITGEVTFDFRATDESSNIKIELNTTDTWSSPTSVYVVGINAVKRNSTDDSGLQLKNYDLKKCTGMCYWKKKWWLWGSPEAPTAIFASANSEPTYFPYPNNFDYFDEPVIKLVPMQDKMYVFTSSKMIEITLAETAWTKKIVQSGLSIDVEDGKLIKAVKNMIYFKSGKDYYMIVPKTLSVTNELALAPVSKNISYFFNNFYENVLKIMKEMTGNTYYFTYQNFGSQEIKEEYNFVDFDDVHNVFCLKLVYPDTTSNLVIERNLFFDLVYNTSDRSWRIYTLNNRIIPIGESATSELKFVVPLYSKFSNDITHKFTGVSVISKVDGNFEDTKDVTLPYNYSFADTLSPTLPTNMTIGTTAPCLLIDSGYRNDNTDLKKRYRELQFKMNNVSQSGAHSFFTTFMLDGETRVAPTIYRTVIDRTEGTINIVRVDTSNTALPTVQMPGQTELDEWQLDVSEFPEIAFWKARIKISGKGYTPRFLLATRSANDFELLGYSWVCRDMYAR